MPALRKSAASSEARRKALEKAADFATRHQTLLDLSERYFEAEAQMHAVGEETQRKIDEVHAKAKKIVAELNASLKQSAKEMIATQEPKANVAQRLGLTTAALNRLIADEKTTADEGSTNAVGTETEQAGQEANE
ncbi:hypothetical protein [Arthrobacter sp. MMS18-M83]|uniref:hypothetical protein n=1 Tax=Arthrobacter sp. MMS18-M83 TaxID=2996261 RepID=UPI00227BB67B|nr:hypothetical protein [Arthrobacter sp. MMS18-M83]WAH99740.1 hypothetical protein OW521_24065 [Arthrobacter sp. MMS18-M83]